VGAGGGYWKELEQAALESSIVVYIPSGTLSGGLIGASSLHSVNRSLETPLL